MSYWVDREAEAKMLLQKKTEKEISTQTLKYYQNSFRKLVKEFEAVYDKVQASVGEGKQPTPADLYKLDRYWQLQSQLSIEAQKLGDKSVSTMNKLFEKQWKKAYDLSAIPSSRTFIPLADKGARQGIQKIWCVDGKHFSDRVWGNTNKLVNELNDCLVNAVMTGKTNKQLIEGLSERYGVSYNQARTLARTETARINADASCQKYKDAGITHIQVISDGAMCDDCADNDNAIYPVDENPVPFHPNCRCCVVAVFEEE